MDDAGLRRGENMGINIQVHNGTRGQDLWNVRKEESVYKVSRKIGLFPLVFRHQTQDWPVSSSNPAGSTNGNFYPVLHNLVIKEINDFSPRVCIHVSR